MIVIAHLPVQMWASVALPTASVATAHSLCMAGKAAKFLGKLGQKLARNVYNEAGEALQGHMRTAADLRATLAPCYTGASTSRMLYWAI